MQRAVLLALTLAACHSPPPPVPPAPPPTCAAAAAHVASLYKPDDDRRSRAHDLLARRCDEDHWTASVRVCLVSKTSLDDSSHCKDQLTPAQRATLELEATAAVEAPSPDDGLPASCREYGTWMEKLMACDQLPQATRDALKAAYDQVKSAWASVPAEGREGLGAACLVAADALRQAGTSVCGW